MSVFAMDETHVTITSRPEEMAKLSSVEQTQLFLARLMEGGQEDDETCYGLDQLGKLLIKDKEAAKKNSTHESICRVIDDDCMDTFLSYLDMRQADAVRAHATMTVSAYLRAAGEDGSGALSRFFFGRVKRGTYDDFIVAFCVAAAVFPVAPDVISDMVLDPSFLPSLGTLMQRKWKSRKVETACLEMLNAVSMNSHCRDAISKYCSDWLEVIVDQDPAELEIQSADTGVEGPQGSVHMRRHSEAAQNLAAVILAKLRAVPSQPQPRQAPGLVPGREGSPERARTTTSSIEHLSRKFTSMIIAHADAIKEHPVAQAIEGLAYATIRPNVKEEVATNPLLLKQLVKILAAAKPKSPLTYGALSVFSNLTRYRPTQSEEENKICQLQSYANAGGTLPPPDALDDDAHVAARCKAVYEANLMPVLVTHGKSGSTASLCIIISIIRDLSATTASRGQLAQQGAVNLLMAVWASLPDTESQAKRAAAQALARILISINPSLVFGGTRPLPQTEAVRPLVSIIRPDVSADRRDLLPSFEALMALTNLASADSETRTLIIRTAWSDIEEQLLSSNEMVARAAVELICNLVQSSEAVKSYSDDSPQARNRLHTLLALADAEDAGTRSAAGGALAQLTSYEPVVSAILKRDRGVQVLLCLCAEETEELRHRGAFVVHNIILCGGATGKLARRAVKAENGLDILKDCAKKSRSAEVVEVAVHALKILLDDS